ncbi:hypothetical protein [Deinococcus peraridilitoris]|uniref:Uncharacterized protein n=1 Tax=Deinococcus peraridilitoris (strain DSM 19664 / LMG 22246 / CIP 109416 / KR-200) TaxID=937777 RepID=L0A6V4_DEIPD|nr:hypothetical protein [Deinococcus peraridilitoris]AFZ69164.1 hypothetical protein Deipe_3738 [Deinococcus peraridilitoris DSM 19664]
MKRTLLASSFLLLGSAQALTLSGSVAGEAPAKARVGAWLIDAAGRPVAEVASAPISANAFSLSIPDTAPSGRALWGLTSDSIAWPGVTGEVNVSGSVQGSEARLFVYGDANGNTRRDEGEELIEGSARLGKASVALVFASRPVNVSAARGLSVALTLGWNVVSIELGKTLKAGVQSGASGLQLSIAR